MHKESFESINKETTIEELAEIVKGNISTLKVFASIVEPNKYMIGIYEYFNKHHAGSVKYIKLFYKKIYKPKVADDTVRKGIEEELAYLSLLGLINKEVLYYSSPRQVTIWIAPYAKKEKIDEAIKQYPYEEGFKQRQKKVYEHKSSKQVEEEKPIVAENPGGIEKEEDTLYYCSNWRDHSTEPQKYTQNHYTKNNGECANCNSLLVAVET